LNVAVNGESVMSHSFMSVSIVHNLLDVKATPVVAEYANPGTFT
jgi:hypothetical protein